MTLCELKNRHYAKVLIVIKLLRSFGLYDETNKVKFPSVVKHSKILSGKLDLFANANDVKAILKLFELRAENSDSKFGDKRYKNVVSQMMNSVGLVIIIPNSKNILRDDHDCTLDSTMNSFIQKYNPENLCDKLLFED